MRSLRWLSVAGIVALTACGDDAAGAEPCPMTLMAGQTQACMCDAVTVGAQMCGANGLLEACECVPGTPTPTGGTGSSTSGGSGGEGGTSSSTGTGGGGGTTAPMMDEDAGMAMMAPDGGSGGMEPTVQMDGNQNSYCESGLDCNKGLDCYLPTGMGAGYCTIPCNGDMPCMGLSGADYTCSGEGFCRVICKGMDDTMSCPDGMECLPGVPGPTSGPRCNWPAGGVPAGGTEAYGKCMSNSACVDGLQCALPFSSPFPGSGGTGYCTKPCMMDSSVCPDAPASSKIAATCEPGELGSTNGVCALNCYGSPMGCPEGMTCQSFAGGFFRRCAY